jgi:hypothetical protein
MIHLIALAFTLLVEGVGMALLALLLPGWRPHWQRAVLVALGLNLLSHTVFWYTLPLIALPPETAIPAAELAVIAAEGAVYAVTIARPPWTGWFVSLALNWASWVLSVYIWR